MSQFVSTNATGLPVLGSDDVRHGDEYYFDGEDAFQPGVLYSWDWLHKIESAGFVSPWWPARGCLLGEGSPWVLLDIAARYSDWLASIGANGRFSIAGYTRDAFGSVLTACTVRLYRTSTGEMQSQVTSDSNGFFLITSPYNDAHFMTVHRGGSVAGASVDTLLPG